MSCIPHNLSRMFLLAIFFATLSACAKIPFHDTPLPLLDNPNPTTFPAHFASQIPSTFTTEDTIIIDTPFEQIAALGMLRVDRSAQSFQLLCLNHMGVQIFHLTGNHDKTDIPFALPPLLEKREVLLAIAQDIRRIYFNLTPSQTAVSAIHSTYILYRDPSPNPIQYQYGGPNQTLLEKRCPGLLYPLWRVRYYEYTTDQSNHIFPRGIVLDNNQFFYRLIIKNRSWQVE